MIRTKGKPALLGMGDAIEPSYVDVGDTLVAPTYQDWAPLASPVDAQSIVQNFLASQPQVPTYDYTPSPQLVQPTPNVPNLSTGASAITALANAGTAVANAFRAGTPTSTLTPAQLAALQAAQKVPSGTSSWLAQSSVLPGVTNQNLLLGGAALALVLALAAGRK